MRIGIDARFGLSGGIDRYILQLVKSLSRIDRRNSYVVYVSPPEEMCRLDTGGATNVTLVPFPRARYHPLASLALSRKIREDGIDVFHALSYWMVPVFSRCALVATVHDTLALTGNANSVAGGLYGRVANGFAVRNASALITVSEYTRTELMRSFPSCRAKTTAIHHGVGSEFRPRSAAENDDVTQRYGLGRSYLLYVGSLKSNKNIDRMLQAYALLPAALRDQHPLVCVGGPANDNVSALVDRCGLHAGRSIHFVPFLEKEATLRSIYQGAAAVVMPSLHEYFGFPLVEAMACHIPVACSNSSCMREIAGDAAVYFDPLVPADIAAGLERVLTDGVLRASLVEAGRQNLERFSWEKTARNVMEVYERVWHA